MNKSSVRYERIDEIFSITIILLPFLYQYKGIGNAVSFGEMILLPIMFYYLLIVVRSKKVDKIDWKLLDFYVVSILMTLINAICQYFRIEDAATLLLRMVYYMILVYVARKHFVFECVQDIYFFFVEIFSLYLIAQFLYHAFTGGFLPIYIEYSLQFPPEARPSTYAELYWLGFRASSLFLEASYFALYVLPTIAILLFKERRSIPQQVVLVSALVAVVLSTSSAGVIGVLILILIKIIRGKKVTIKSLISKISITAIGISGCLYIFFGKNSDLLRRRLVSGGSIGERVLRGIVAYSRFTPFHQIFGVGLNNLSAYMKFNSISTPWDESNLNNCCSLFQTLDFFGIIGFVALLVYLGSIVRKSRGKVGFPLVTILVFIMSYESILFMYRFAFLIIILEAVNRIERRGGKI